MTMTTTMTAATEVGTNEYSSEILLAACPGSGHVGPIISLAKFLLAEKMRVTLALPIPTGADLPKKLPTTSNFRCLRIDLPAEQTTFLTSFIYLQNEFKAIATEIIRQGNFAVKPPAAVISDMMAGPWSRALVDALQVPEYIFFPSPFTTIFFFQHIDKINSLRAELESSPSDEKVDIYLPGIRNAIDVTNFPQLPPEFRDIFRNCFKLHHEAKAAIVQDLNSLYPRPQPLLESINDTYHRKCEETGFARAEPFKVFPVGALCLFDEPPQSALQPPEIEWLNRQKPKSVVFAALGSWLQITVADTIELARGLELSGLQFLMAYRGHSSDNGHDEERALPEAADETGLPLTFRSDVEEKGLVLPWVDQAAVLRHPAIACFLTHCGWNSTMEALALAGVPLVLLPVGAEQGVNACILEEEWKCGQRVWDMKKGRQLERHRIADTIVACATDDGMQKAARNLHAKLNEAVTASGSVLEARRQLSASLMAHKVQPSG